MTRTTHRELDEWLRDGRIEPMPAALAAHVSSCSECDAALGALDEVRSWFPDETPEMSRDAAASIRFRLQSEARSHGAAKTTRAAGSSRGWMLGMAAAAAVVLAVGGALAFVGLRDGETQVAARPAVPRATVSAAPGAAVREVDAETYRMSEGSAWFEVPPRARGHRFRVLVGDERVEVHGTRFQVRARAGVLDAVEVAHGIVSVHLTSGAVHRIVAGERYDRTVVVRRGLGPNPLPPSEVNSDGAPRPEERFAPRFARNPSPSTADAASSGAGPLSPPREPFDEAQGRRVGVRPIDPAAVDRAFRDAWQLRSAGRHDDAARAFDALLTRGGLGARRADVLYWSARAHENAGRRQLATERLEKLVRTYPRAWHAAEARRRLEAMSGQ